MTAQTYQYVVLLGRETPVSIYRGGKREDQPKAEKSAFGRALALRPPFSAVRAQRPWRGSAWSTVRFAGSNARGSAVVSTLPLPAVRNGCVSGEFVACSGRLLARATNCRSALLLSRFPGC